MLATPDIDDEENHDSVSFQVSSLVSNILPTLMPVTETAKTAANSNNTSPDRTDDQSHGWMEIPTFK